MTNTPFTVVTETDFDTEIEAMKQVRDSVLDRFAGSGEAGLRRMDEILERIDTDIAELERGKRLAEREAAEAELGNPTPLFGALMGEFFGS